MAVAWTGPPLLLLFRKTFFSKGFIMLHWSLVFLIIALVAGFFGFFGLEGLAMEIAKVLFFVFLVIFIISLLAGRRSFYPPG